MKKIIVCLAAVLILLSYSAIGTYATPATAEPVVLTLSGGSITGNKFEINATVQENPGILSALLTLEYDKSAMTLCGIEIGEALSSLSCITTNTSTAEGYGIYPFGFSYEGEADDTSTGQLLKLSFEIKSGVENGTYTVALRCDKEAGAVYSAETSLAARPVLISSVKISIENGSVQEIKTVAAETEKRDMTLLIWLSAAASLAMVATVTVIAVTTHKKHKKAWVKL